MLSVLKQGILQVYAACTLQQVYAALDHTAPSLPLLTVSDLLP